LLKKLPQCYAAELFTGSNLCPQSVTAPHRHTETVSSFLDFNTYAEKVKGQAYAEKVKG